MFIVVTVSFDLTRSDFSPLLVILAVFGYFSLFLVMFCSRKRIPCHLNKDAARVPVRKKARRVTSFLDLVRGCDSNG